MLLQKHNVTSIKGVIAEKTQELDKLTQNYYRSKSHLNLVNITERYDGIKQYP
ncbi:MAG: hypothetical protein ACLT33_09200 [Lachnospira pectinoschiza]